MESPPDRVQCRLCAAAAPLFFRDRRTFFKCSECSLIFTPDRASRAEEESHYRSQWEHERDASWDSGARFLLDLIRMYREPRHILDFGAGSGKLTEALRRQGVPTTPLEPMRDGFLSDRTFPERFDVVVAVEVIEHIPDFWAELRLLETVLDEDGLMVFTTLLTTPFISLPESAEMFADWWYKDDPTHVNFFSPQALNRLAELGPYDIDIFQDKMFTLRRRGP